MKFTIGTCGICGGAVTRENGTWLGTEPPPARCESCGATPKAKHGPVIEMERPAGRMCVGAGGTIAWRAAAGHA
jgi:hypothetical protein